MVPAHGHMDQIEVYRIRGGPALDRSEIPPVLAQSCTWVRDAERYSGIFQLNWQKYDYNRDEFRCRLP